MHIIITYRYCYYTVFTCTHRLIVVLRVAVHDRHPVVHHHGGLLDLTMYLRVWRRHGHRGRRESRRRRVPVVHAAVATHVTTCVHAGVRFAALQTSKGSVIFTIRNDSGFFDFCVLRYTLTTVCRSNHFPFPAPKIQNLTRVNRKLPSYRTKQNPNPQRFLFNCKRIRNSVTTMRSRPVRMSCNNNANILLRNDYRKSKFEFLGMFGDAKDLLAPP